MIAAVSEDQNEPGSQLIELFGKSGVDVEAELGTLLQHCRAYLLAIANAEMPADLSVQIAPSDLVQETFAEAVVGFDQFRGKTSEELRGWLRTTLLRNIADARKHYFEAKKRCPGVELPPHHPAAPERIANTLADPISSPSSIAVRRETAEQIRAAIDRLPEDYRLVMRLRHFEGLTLEKIGEQMGRSAESVRKLWCRALEKLAELLDDESSR